MSNFNGIYSVSVQASDGGLVSDGANVAASEKVLFDEPIGTPGVMDFTPFLAGVTTPLVVIIKSDVTFTVSEDGTHFSTVARKVWYGSGFAAGSLPLKITTTAPSLRTQMLVIGL